jgi:hypothetical protein
LNEPDTSRKELIVALVKTSKIQSEPLIAASNADAEMIRRIQSCKNKVLLLKDGTPYQKAQCSEFISTLRKTSGRSIDPDGKLDDADFLKAFIQDCEDSVPPSLRDLIKVLRDGAQCESISALRETRSGRSIDPDGKLNDTDFLKAFIQHYGEDYALASLRGLSSSWPRAGPPRVCKAGDKKERDARYTNELEQLAWQQKARLNRFITPDKPDAGVLNDLWHRIKSTDPATWATLRELKLATAMPERAVRTIILKSEPKTREIVNVPFRPKWTKRGACPKRYAPRLVIAVLREFLTRLSAIAVSDEKERLRSLANRLVRSLGQKVSRVH